METDVSVWQKLFMPCSSLHSEHEHLKLAGVTHNRKALNNALTAILIMATDVQPATKLNLNAELCHFCYRQYEKMKGELVF